MKKTKRQSSIGSAGWTNCSTPAKSSSLKSPSGELKSEEQQTKVYLNSLELQAALTQQQTVLARAELAQQQAKMKALATNLDKMQQRRKRNEALMIAQEGEVASLKIAASYVAAQSLPKRVEDTRKALDEQVNSFQDLVCARPLVLEQRPARPVQGLALDRVGELIVGQIRMYESRLEQKEQEIRSVAHRFMQELGFMAESGSLLNSQIRDETQMRSIELRKALKLTRHSLPSPRTRSVNGNRFLPR